MITFNFKLNYEELLEIANDTSLNRDEPNDNQNELYNTISDFDFMYSNLLLDDHLNVRNALIIGKLFSNHFYDLTSSNTATDLQKTIYFLTRFNSNFRYETSYIDFIKEIRDLKNITDPQSKMLYEQFIKEYIDENTHYNNILGNVLILELNPNNEDALNKLFQEKCSSIYNNNSSYSYFRLQNFLSPEKTLSESGRIKLSFYIGMLHYVLRNELTKKYLLKCYRFIIENRITTSKTTGAFKSLYLEDKDIIDTKDINNVLNFMKEEVPEDYERKYLDMYFKAIKKYGVEINI